MGDTGPTPNGPAPGGVQAFDQGGTTYIRLQDTGNPEAYGWLQGSTRPQNSNRRLNFGHRLDTEGPLESELVLDDGITFSIRARIPNSGPLDLIYPVNTSNQPTGSISWDTTRGGYPIHDNGRGMFYLVQNDTSSGFNIDSALAFSLFTQADATAFNVANAAFPTSSGGLVLNNLNGDVANPFVDSFSPGTINVLPLSDSQLHDWLELWVTIEGNELNPGTHDVSVYVNGSTVPTVFQVTATSDNNAEYVNNAWLALGMSSTPLFGALDVDFYGYSLGVIAPTESQIGDFDHDGLRNCADVDALVARIAAGSSDLTFDINSDGQVDRQDLSHWLAVAGHVNLPGGGAYLAGDANLDGVVDGSDYGIWNSHKFTNTPAWCSGDFNADGAIDGSDFAIWNSHKFTASSAALVPEPNGIVLLAGCLASIAIGRGVRRRTS